MEVGYHLNETEISNIINSFKEKQKFHNLIEEMKKYAEFDLSSADVEVEQGLKFDVTNYENVITAKGLVLKINDNLRIRYISRYINGETENTKDFFFGNILAKSSEQPEVIEQIVLTAGDDKLVSIQKSVFNESEVSSLAEANEKFDEEFNYDPNYQPGQLLEQVNAQNGPITGCIAGGYIYCGQECGGAAACYSTKKPVNSTDSCCKTHDCCYSTYGTKYPHCYCDQRLCDCTQKSPFYKADLLIQGVFCLVC